MDLRGYVDITELDQRELAKAAYAASRPQGMGFMHFKEGGLDEETLDQIMERAKKYHHGAIDLDYVHGRACKLTVRIHEEHYYVQLNWFDHSAAMMKGLLRLLKLPDVEARIAAAEVGEAEKEREYLKDRENSRREHL